MSLRERLLAVLNGGRADATPWFTDLNYWYHSRNQNGILPSEFSGPDGLLALHKNLRVGIYVYPPPLVNTKRDPELFNVTARQRDDLTTEIQIKTPEGVLTQVTKFCPASCSTAVLEYPVKTVSDLKCVRAWYEGATYSPNYEAVLECDMSWGDCGVALPLLPRTPLAALHVEWIGLTNLVEILAENPEELYDTIKVMRRAEDELYRLVCAAPYPFVVIPDNLSAETMYSLWNTFSRDYYVEKIGELHASGKKVACHIDGTLGRLLKSLIETGVDFPEAVTPAPVGDLSLEVIREAVGPETVVWGRVPGAMFAPPFTKEEVLGHVRRVLDVLGKEMRLVLAGAVRFLPMGILSLCGKLESLSRNTGQNADQS